MHLLKVYYSHISGQQLLPLLSYPSYRDMSDASPDWSVYLTFIEACYRGYPEAVCYYDRLIGHLRKSSSKPDTARTSALQRVNIYQVTDGNTTTYPTAFPFTAVDWQHRQDRVGVAILEGYPSPNRVNFLGSRFGNIRPEFFIANLADTKDASGGLYELPNLVFAQDNLVRIQFASLIRSLIPASDSGQLGQKRSLIENALLRYDKSLACEGRYGATRFRQVNMHDHQVYSTEETVSLTIAFEGSSWCGSVAPLLHRLLVLTKDFAAVILTDHGRTFGNYQGLPWRRCDANGRPGGTIPLVPYNTPVTDDLKDSGGHIPRQRIQASLDQFHPLKNIILSDEIDRQLLEADPFFLLASLLKTSFRSWAQLLNFLTESISQYQSRLDSVQTERSYHLEQLRYHIVILIRAKDFFMESHDLIKLGGCPSWPKAKTPETKLRKQIIQQQLEVSHSKLIERCSMLIGQCESATAMLVAFAQLTASDESVSQAEEVNRLTKMAAIFIPLSFTASIFGMNVREWNPPPSWK